MTLRPPTPQHFSSAPPPLRPNSRKNVALGLLAVVVTAGALAYALVANRRIAQAEHRAARAEAARRASEAARHAEIQRAARQVAKLKERMRKLAAEAGVAGPSAQ